MKARALTLTATCRPADRTRGCHPSTLSLIKVTAAHSKPRHQHISSTGVWSLKRASDWYDHQAVARYNSPHNSCQAIRLSLHGNQHQTHCWKTCMPRSPKILCWRSAYWYYLEFICDENNLASIAWPAWGHAGPNAGQTLRCFQDKYINSQHVIFLKFYRPLITYAKTMGSCMNSKSTPYNS